MGAAAQTTAAAALSEEWLSRTDGVEAFYAGLRDKFVPGKPLWITETADATCGGNPWGSTFLDSFRYLDQLGRLAKRSVQVIAHNTLASSDCGLLDEDTLTPRPDYWTALLWRRLMGMAVLNLGPSPVPSLHLYARCMQNCRGGVVLPLINADQQHTHDIMFIPPIPAGSELAAILVVICFSAGLNVYATVAMLGLLVRAEILSLPASLHLVENWYVIAVCTALFLVEFVGDKIPFFDLLWNAAHTFVRIPVAALLAFAATTHLPEWEQILATLLGTLIALAAHGGKTAARAMITQSPEPFSNVALSLSEDATVVFLMWFATKHPYIAAAAALAGVVIVVLMIRLVVRAMRSLFGRAERALTSDRSAGSAR
jgi:hypothetical protein